MFHLYTTLSGYYTDPFCLIFSPLLKCSVVYIICCISFSMLQLTKGNILPSGVCPDSGNSNYTSTTDVQTGHYSGCMALHFSILPPSGSLTPNETWQKKKTVPQYICGNYAMIKWWLLTC